MPHELYRLMGSAIERPVVAVLNCSPYHSFPEEHRLDMTIDFAMKHKATSVFALGRETNQEGQTGAAHAVQYLAAHWHVRSAHRPADCWPVVPQLEALAREHSVEGQLVELGARLAEDPLVSHKTTLVLVADERHVLVVRFLAWRHLRHSFPHCHVVCDQESHGALERFGAALLKFGELVQHVFVTTTRQKIARLLPV